MDGPVMAVTITILATWGWSAGMISSILQCSHGRSSSRASIMRRVKLGLHEVLSSL